MRLKILKALIRSEEWLINKFSPYFTEEDMLEYKEIVDRHKREIK